MTEFSPGSILSHYRSLSKIDAGAVRKVYLAQDTFKLSQTDSFKDSLRDDPRFADLVKRVGLPDQ